MGFQRLTRGKGLIGNGFNPTVRRIKITTTPTGVEQDTGVDLPARAIVLGVYLHVTTAEATGSTTLMDIGLKAGESGGDADGFLDGIECDTLGLVKGTSTVTVGSNNTYISATTHGVLMRDFVAGEDTATAGDGAVSLTPHLSDSVTAKSVVFTSSDTDWAEFRGAIYIEFIEI